MLTQADLDRIAARASEATPGPWKADPGDGYLPIYAPQPPKVTNKGYKGATAPQPHVEIVKLDNPAACGDPDCCQDSPFVYISRKDAEFIAHAREDIPTLLAEVARLRELTGSSP